MLTVELKRVPEGHSDYVTVARLEVDDQGTYRLTDPEEFFPLELAVLLPPVEDGDPPRKITLDEDPATWARNLHTILRTGYLVPVVTEVAGAGERDGQGEVAGNEGTQ